MDLGKTPIFYLFLLFSSSAWSSVFVQWSDSQIPSPSSFGVSNVVFSWKSRVPASLLATACKQGYRVYVEAQLGQAAAAAEETQKVGGTGLILTIPKSDRTGARAAVTRLRSAYPKLLFLVLDLTGKQPQMRGSLVIKNDSVLEVSSPTMQPWIDTNLAAIEVAREKNPKQVPLYTFAWGTSNRGQQESGTASDYSLAVAEAGAVHADLVF